MSTDRNRAQSFWIQSICLHLEHLFPNPAPQKCYSQLWPNLNDVHQNRIISSCSFPILLVCEKCSAFRFHSKEDNRFKVTFRKISD